MHTVKGFSARTTAAERQTSKKTNKQKTAENARKSGSLGEV